MLFLCDIDIQHKCGRPQARLCPLITYLYPQHIELWLATTFPMKYGLLFPPYYLLWSATVLDGSNIRALRCAAGAQKNIPISPEITAWVALTISMPSCGKLK